LNQAYKTLSSPLERGLYLLEIQGHPLSDEREIIMEPNFLNEVMEINEKIHEVENKNDLERIQKANEITLGKLLRYNMKKNIFNKKLLIILIIYLSGKLQMNSETTIGSLRVSTLRN
jgi:hypothetical protein